MPLSLSSSEWGAWSVATGIHDASADAVHQRLHIIGGTDGRVHTVIAGIIGEPQVVRGHLAGDGCPRSFAIWMASSAPRVDTWHMCSLVW
ncbi:hypothetical protein [Faecalibacterium taiwanense]|uniref:hypothetical protein n=1 Tax=Faecalibacterium taiwanense TaxID=3030638 RepID=UPI003AAD853C